MIAANIMTTDAFLPEKATLLDAAELVSGQGAAAVLAADSTVLGVITEDRLIERITGLGADPSVLASWPAAGAMEGDFAEVAPQAGFKEVSLALDGAPSAVVVVVDDGGRPLGLITQRDMLRRLWKYAQKR